MTAASTAVMRIRAGPKGSCPGAAAVRAGYPSRRGYLPTVDFAELRVLTMMTHADSEGDAGPYEDDRPSTRRCRLGRVSGLRGSASPFKAAVDTPACNLPATRRTMQHRKCADDAPTKATLRPFPDFSSERGETSLSVRGNQTPGCASSPPPSATEETGTPFLADAEQRQARSDRTPASGVGAEAYTCKSISKGHRHHRMPYYIRVYLTILIGQALNVVVFQLVWPRDLPR